MENKSLKRALQNEAGESIPQKRGKATEDEAGKIDYTIQRRSPSLTHDTLSTQAKSKTIDSEAISFKRPFGSEKTSMSFPEKLMRILSFPEFSNVIRWNRDGTEFCIHPSDFSETVLNPHFQGTKFQSFTRKLNRWGFKRILDEERYPKGTFAYQHEHFQRGREDLMKLMEIDSDKKQRKAATNFQVSFNQNEASREESEDENLSVRRDSLASYHSGTATSSTNFARLPDVSAFNYFASQEELNRLQLLMGSQSAIQRELHMSQPRLMIPRQASLPDLRSILNPMFQPTLPPSLYLQSSQMSVPSLDTALGRDLSYRRQHQLAQALRQLPLPRQQPQGQQSIDPLLLHYLILERQQQQEEEQRRNSSSQP